MSRRPASITQADVNRALRAAGQCGYPTEVVILPGGTIVIRPAGATPIAPAPPAPPPRVDDAVDLSF